MLRTRHSVACGLLLVGSFSAICSSASADLINGGLSSGRLGKAAFSNMELTRSFQRSLRLRDTTFSRGGEPCRSSTCSPSVALRIRGGGDMKAKLVELGQEHLFEGLSAEQSEALLAQAVALDQQLPGGLTAYINTARKLLKDSAEGVNPFEGFVPSVPIGAKPEVGSAEFMELETNGIAAANEAGFVLVAGGLGERLGYTGIKVSLPLYLAERQACFLEHYIKHILSLQAENGNTRQIPLAIMTSDDTHALTVALLEDNANFGMPADQITIMKQNKVPALIDSTGRMAVEGGVIQTKPHGHGDVHTLMLQSGVMDKWSKGGVKWVVFFQDTNGIIFRALPSVLGVSAKLGAAINSVCVPRTPGEAVGGICKLSHGDGRVVTVNVEYNQLDPLLRTTKEFSKGDVADPATGNSPFPGNINILVFQMEQYKSVLQATEGKMNEFVNPKYTDATKTAFKKPTRLECMMQDFPLLLPPDATVGFTQLPRFICFSPVKNNIKDAKAKGEQGIPVESAGSAERDAMSLNCQLLKMAGCDVPTEGNPTSFGGISLDFSPMVVLHPSFGTCLSSIKKRIAPDAQVKISAKSALVLDGDIHIQGKLELDGALVIRAAPGAKVVVKKLSVANEGWTMVADEGASDDMVQMRGYTVHKAKTEELVFNHPGDFVVDM
mmetsp:Transcript_66535/g.138695  ORF Transcript_66535/g.138695 Transcript_66535/m.138695 type:complete len:666 (-) Transcript_66535:380-2377(-)